MKTENQILRTALADLLEVVNWLGMSGNIRSPIEPHPYGIGVAMAKSQARNALALSTHSQASSTPKTPSDAATGTPEGKE